MNRSRGDKVRLPSFAHDENGDRATFPLFPFARRGNARSSPARTNSPTMLASRRSCIAIRSRARRHSTHPRHPHGHIRLRHHRRRLGRQRARQPAERRPRHQHLRARSRTRRLASLHPPAGRLHQDVLQHPHQLVLFAGAGPVDRRPPHLLATRQDAGRLQLDQRPHLQSRPAPGFRHLGADGQPWLGLRGRAALLQAPGAAHRQRRCHLSRP